MKRSFYAILLAVFCSFGLTVSAQARISVLTTIFPPFDFARAVAGEMADVAMLLPPGAEAHDFEPTPRDIIRMQNSSLFIYTGGENDVWIEKLLASFGSRKPKTLRLMDCVPEEAKLEESGGVQDNFHGHEHGKEHSRDEHVWTSPVNAAMIVDRIASEMAALDPDSAESFSANSNALKNELMELDARFEELIASSKRKHLLFADRFPFVYFAHRYGLTYDAAFSGCSTETEPSAATIAFLTKRAAELKLPVVFTMEMSNTKMADTICEVTGSRRLTLNSGHGVTADQMKKGITYTDILRDNLEALREALN